MRRVQSTDVQYFSRERVVDVLQALGHYSPRCASRLLSYYDRPLIDYLASLFEAVSQPSNPISRRARALLTKSLNGWFSGSLPECELHGLTSELQCRGVLQTGPHCELILNPPAFAGTAMGLLGAERAGARFILAYTCGTVKFEHKSKSGPGWLRSQDHLVRIFNRSREFLKYSNVVSSTGLFTIDLIPEEPNPELEQTLTSLRSVFRNIAEQSAADAFRAANRRLLAMHQRSTAPTCCYIDDRFFGKLMMLHLEDSSSLLCKLLFSRRRLKLSAGLTMASQKLQNEMFPGGTSFFWRVHGHKLKPLILSDDRLQDVADSSITYQWTPSVIHGLLSEHRLIPDLFCIFLIGVLLPAHRALGGFVQMAYLPAFLAVLRGVLDLQDEEERGLLADLNCLDVHGLASEFLPRQAELSEIRDYAPGYGPSFSDIVSGASLRDCTQALSRLRRHVRWNRLLTHAMEVRHQSLGSDRSGA